MKFAETHASRARAAHCVNQAGMARDTLLKKFWDDLADDWMALDSTMLAVDSARINPSFNRMKEPVADPENLAFTGKRRVVIIDDDLAFAELLTALVGRLGHDAVVKGDSSASHTYEVRDSDIVFVDLMMPKINGIQVLEQLAHQNVKSAIVLISSNARFLDEAEKIVRKMDLHLLGVLYKPFHLPDVQSLLEAA